MNEVKEVKKRRTFKEIILRQLDIKGKNLPDYSYDPIRETIAEALNELEIQIEKQKNVDKTHNKLHRTLSKFTKEEIENYLKELWENATYNIIKMKKGQVTTRKVTWPFFNKENKTHFLEIMKRNISSKAIYNYKWKTLNVIYSCCVHIEPNFTYFTSNKVSIIFFIHSLDDECIYL